MIKQNNAKINEFDIRFINENNKYFIAKENIKVILIVISSFSNNFF